MLLLFGAGLLEIVWAIALKKIRRVHASPAERHRDRRGMGELILLTIALHTLPGGTAYAVWVGIGAVGVALVGILAFNEAASLARLSGSPRS